MIPVRPTKPEPLTKEELERRLLQVKAEDSLKREKSIRATAENIVSIRIKNGSASAYVLGVPDWEKEKIVEVAINIATELYDYKIPERK